MFTKYAFARKKKGASCNRTKHTRFVKSFALGEKAHMTKKYKTVRLIRAGMTKLVLAFKTPENEYETPLKTHICCRGIQFFNFKTILVFQRKCKEKKMVEIIKKKKVKIGNRKLKSNRINACKV